VGNQPKSAQKSWWLMQTREELTRDFREFAKFAKKWLTRLFPNFDITHCARRPGWSGPDPTLAAKEVLFEVERKQGPDDLSKETGWLERLGPGYFVLQKEIIHS